MQCNVFRPKEFFAQRLNVKEVSFRKTHCKLCMKAKEAPRAPNEHNEVTRVDTFECIDCKVRKVRKDFSRTQQQKPANSWLCLNCARRHETTSWEQGIEAARKRGATCKKCQKEVSGEKLTKQVRNDVQDHGVGFLCEECQEYECSRCFLVGARKVFQKTHFTRSLSCGSQQCLECHEGRRGGAKCLVDVCRKFVPEEQLTANEKKHYRKQYLCPQCFVKGYTLKDHTTYACTRANCIFRGPRSSFPTQQFQRALTRKTLLCQTCHASRGEDSKRNK